MTALRWGLCLLLGSTGVWAETPTPPASLLLADVFSTEKNPGKGALDFSKTGSEPLKITFGAETGHYLVGVVFPKEILPEAIRQDFRRNDVIQLAMGTVSRTLGTRVPQFGAASLMVLGGGKQQQRVVPLRIPGPSEMPLPETGYFLFASPEMQNQVTDEEKLKNTFFAKAGSMILSASSPPQSLQVTADGRKLPFKMQAMRLELQASLATPFSNEENRISGRVEFPLYWADSAQGRLLLKKLAETSFQTQTSIKIPDEITPSRRQISGKK